VAERQKQKKERDKKTKEYGKKKHRMLLKQHFFGTNKVMKVIKTT
jgi:hypothetical protein